MSLAVSECDTGPEQLATAESEKERIFRESVGIEGPESQADKCLDVPMSG